MCWVSHTINHCFLDGPGAPASFQQGGHRPTRRGGTFMGQVIGMKAFHRKNGWIYGGCMWIYGGYMVDLWWIYGGFMMDLWWIYSGFMVDLWWIDGGFMRIYGGFM